MKIKYDDDDDDDDDDDSSNALDTAINRLLSGADGRLLAWSKTDHTCFHWDLYLQMLMKHHKYTLAGQNS